MNLLRYQRGGLPRAVAWRALHLLWTLVRIALCAVLALVEPLLRITLVPLAFGGFFVTLLALLIGDTRFPVWGMLGMSVALLWLYGVFMLFVGWVMGGPR